MSCLVRFKNIMDNIKYTLLEQVSNYRIDNQRMHRMPRVDVTWPICVLAPAMLARVLPLWVSNLVFGGKEVVNRDVSSDIRFFSVL